MISKICVPGLIAVTIALSGCATPSAENAFSKSQNLQQLTSQKLKAVLDGNTVEWGDGSLVYYDGTEIRALGSDGSAIVGTINFKNNQHCRSWNGGGERCSTVYQGDDGKLSFFVEGEADSSGGYALIINGNPNEL